MREIKFALKYGMVIITNINIMSVKVCYKLYSFCWIDDTLEIQVSCIL
jgi:hypothetical protein